jgi:hypothetical protein
MRARLFESWELPGSWTLKGTVREYGVPVMWTCECSSVAYARNGISSLSHGLLADSTS